MSQSCILVGAPMDCGKRRQGCLMGADALRTAGLAEALSGLGHDVRDIGNVVPDVADPVPVDNPNLHAHAEVVGWTSALMRTARQAASEGTPIFMGGDHALSAGTVAGIAAHAADLGQPQFLLWLDAHTDYHTPESTASGHLHGTPFAYVTGRAGFESFPSLPAPVPLENTCMIGLRSVDPAEHQALVESSAHLADMRAIDEDGIKPHLSRFLDKVLAAKGRLHVSFDVDFLDPSIAPAVGTAVPGGATFREAHLVMEMLHDAGCVTSLDLVELNPFLDDRGKTASLLVDLTASLMGRRIFDRPTQGFDASNRVRGD